MNMNMRNANLSKFDHAIIHQNSPHVIYKFKLTEIDPDDVANKLKVLLEGRARRNIANATRKGFHVTDTEIYNRETCRLFDDLIAAIEARVLDIVNTTNWHALKKIADVKPVVETFWGAYYQKGDSSGWHTHQDIYCYQAVYYADVSDNTPIVFENMVENRREGNLEVRPEKGMLIVFSGRTNHMVPEITSDNTRLVFASNLIYKATK